MPWFEALEDRRLLTVTFTTIPITQTNDDGHAVEITSVQTVANDSLGNPIVYSVAGLPSGLSINGSTGVISGTIGTEADAHSPYTVNLTATDQVTADVGTASFQWNVNPDPVTFTNPGTQTNDDGATINLGAGGSDSIGADTLVYAASGLPKGLAINTATGTITGTIAANADATSPYNVVVTATDSTANASNSETFEWDVSPSPVTVNNPGPQANNNGDTVNLQINAGDSGLGDTLKYSATNLPSGLTINGASGLITGPISGSASAQSPYAVTVTVTDAAANANASQSFTWAVSPLPTVTFTTVPSTQTSFDGAAITGVQTLATDTLVDQFVYGATGLPKGLSINSTTGVISGLIDTGANANSPYTVDLTATDQVTKDVATATFQWDVNPDPITFTNPGTQTNNNGATITLGTGGADSIAGSTLTYTASGLPTGLAISSTTGQVTGTIAVPVVSISGVTNTVNPTITTTAASTLSVGESITIGGVVGATGVNGVFTVASVPTATTFTITDPTAPGDSTSGGAITPNSSVIVTATDSSNNASNSETFAWNINASPVSVTNPGTQTSDDGATVSLQVKATDSITADTLTYSATNLPSGLTINQTTGIISGKISSTADTGSPYAVTVTATDATANTSASQSFTWDVTTGPVTLTSPGNQTSVGLAVIKLQVHATDSIAGDKLTYSATGLPSGLAINPITGIIAGTIAQTANTGSPYNVTVTATDTAANASASQSFTWTVNPGPISGVVFFDANGNGKLDAGDARLAGVTVVLTGSATTSVNITSVTNTVNPTITTATNDNLSVGK